MLRKFVDIVILFNFIFYNSNLFLYQHYCGNELYDTALFHTISCACGDEVSIPDVNSQQIVFNDDGCCQETIIYAHNAVPFYAVQWSIAIFFIFLGLVHGLNFLFKVSLWSFIRSLFYRFFKRTENLFFYLLLHNFFVRSVVLRN